MNLKDGIIATCMSELIQKIMRGEDSIENLTFTIYNVDFSSRYLIIRDNVERLVKQQKVFKKLIGKKPSYLKLRNGFYEKVLKKKQYTLEELFDVQLTNIRGLNINLVNLLRDSRFELQELEEYYEQVNCEVAIMLNSKNKEHELKTKSLEYQTMSHSLKVSKKDENYFKALVKAKKFKRGLFEELHEYNLRNELLSNLAKEALFLDKFEDLLRTSIHTCEKIALKTATLERHLNNTKRTYQLLRIQHKTASSLNKAMATMTDFTLQLQDTLTDGMQEIMDIANSPDYFFTTATDNMDRLIKRLGVNNA
ncbi:MAG: hypothetical protein KKA65_02440 [Nanoarchaeota archaeon]|nr:hypothetical protein [Nanoarchaeota archaeon]MBU4456335.1 hypothetical protein [Nanoarchaeota archaeon]MCG2719181.1 hypothetical protein [Nanoarchaeota archaeon]